MFQHILVPVDLSDRNNQAVDIAVEMAQMSNGRVTLLHIIKLISGGTYDEFADFYQKLEGKAYQKMSNLITPYQGQGVDLTSHILIGHRVQEIINFAAEQQANLIVMNSHKINLENPDEGWGSISHKVGILAQCPIMLVK
ncbi:MAG: universal stress protein [Chloroflexi bacterium]|nr:universal stress protein [Chloroflexota bacterium]